MARENLDSSTGHRVVKPWPPLPAQYSAPRTLGQLRRWGSPSTHRDGEVVPHVLPHEAAPEGLDGPAPLPRRVPVQVPPGGIQDADQPEPCEQEAYEDHSADLGWGGKQELQALATFFHLGVAQKATEKWLSLGDSSRGP